jgi:pentatricopeptide repeat protein
MGRLYSFCFIAILFIESQAFTYLTGSHIRLKRNRELVAWYGHEDSSFRTHSNQTTRPRGYSAKSNSLNKQPSQGIFRERSQAFKEACRLLRDTTSPHEIADWMIYTVQKNVPLGLDPKEGPEFIKELAKRNAYDAVLIFLRQLSDRSVFVYTSTISVLANSKTKRHEAMELLDEMNDIGVQPNAYTFTALFNSVDGAQASTKLLERIRKDYPQVLTRVEVYNAAIHACSRGDRQDWNTALKIFFQMKNQGIKPNQPTFASLLHSCARAGQLRVALSLLNEMKRTMVPNAKVWGAALNACAQAGNYKEATNILLDMQDMGISPTTWHLGALLTALAKAGQHELALQMLEGMEDGNPIVFPVAGGNKKLVLPPVPLDLVAINTVLFACAKVENSQGAKDLLEKLKSGYYTTYDINNNKVPILPDEISYNAVLSACRDPSEAKAIVKEMRMSRRHRHGAIPPSHITFTHAISACRKCQQPDLETALYFLEIAQRDGINPNVFMYSAAIWTAESCGDSDVALAILDKMKEVRCVPNAVTYLGVISTLAMEGRAEEAIQLFEEMKANNIDPTEQIFSVSDLLVIFAAPNLSATTMLTFVLVPVRNLQPLFGMVGIAVASKRYC